MVEMPSQRAQRTFTLLLPLVSVAIAPGVLEIVYRAISPSFTSRGVIPVQVTRLDERLGAGVRRRALTFDE